MTARTQLGQILKRINEKNERFVIDLRGQPQAVIMGINDYIDTFAPTPQWLNTIGQEAKEKGLNRRTMRQIDADIAAARRQLRNKTVPA